MERSEVLEWFRKHPADVHEAPEELLSHCEEEVREHAHLDAWLRARDIAEDRVQYWKHAWGAHASEAFVAREVCRELANDLKRFEPIPEAGQEVDFVDDDVLDLLEPAGRSVILQYVGDLARREEHREWLAVISFTRDRARSLARDSRFSTESSYEASHSYAETAARVMNMLAHEYEQRAHPVRL